MKESKLGEADEPRVDRDRENAQSGDDVVVEFDAEADLGDLDPEDFFDDEPEEDTTFNWYELLNEKHILRPSPIVDDESYSWHYHMVRDTMRSKGQGEREHDVMKADETTKAKKEDNMSVMAQQPDILDQIEV